MSEGAADEKAIPNQVFVGGMTPETTPEELAKHLANLKLSAAGAPAFFKNAQEVSKGCALVPFGTPDEAKAAVTALDNSELAGQKLRARPDRGPKRQRRREQVNQDNSFVYVGGLNPEVTVQELEELFAPYGKVQYAAINRKRRSETSPGWATVQLPTEQDAQRALQELNGKTVKDQAITVEPLRSLPRKPRARKEREPRDPNLPALENAEPEPAVDPSIVWVGNLAWTTNEDQIRALFQAHGAVTDVVVTRQKGTNQSRGWGTVTFENPDQAAAAVAALNGTTLEERNIEVQIRRGPRRRRRAREPRATNDESGAETGAPRRSRRRRPRAQNDEAKPRRTEAKQAEPAEGGDKPRRRRARRPRNDSQRNEENTATPESQNADSEGKRNRNRRRRRTRTDGEAPAEGEQREQRAPKPKVQVDNPDCHLYVRNLAWEVTDDDLKTFFSQSGTVVNAKVAISPNKNTSQGWGTVEMSSAAEAQKALALDKQKFKERLLSVRLDRNVSGRE